MRENDLISHKDEKFSLFERENGWLRSATGLLPSVFLLLQVDMQRMKAGVCGKCIDATVARFALIDGKSDFLNGEFARGMKLLGHNGTFLLRGICL